MIVYLNGEYLPREQARISPEDRGFLFADAVYEVARFWRGRPFHLPEHLERMGEGLAALLPSSMRRFRGGPRCERTRFLLRAPGRPSMRSPERPIRFLLLMAGGRFWPRTNGGAAATSRPSCFWPT